jgi:hypothetical protein
MRVNKNVLRILATGSILALTLNFLFVGQAQAAACSAKDKYRFDRPASKSVYGDFSSLANAYKVAGFQCDSCIGNVFDVLDNWKKETKSKKLKAALEKFEIQFEMHGSSGIRYSNIPSLTAAYKSIETIIKFNRC